MTSCVISGGRGGEEELKGFDLIRNMHNLHIQNYYALSLRTLIANSVALYQPISYK